MQADDHRFPPTTSGAPFLHETHLHRRASSRELTGNPDPDPDAFYGPYLHDRLAYRPDQSGIVVGQLPDAMAATPRRRQPAPNGTPSKSPAAPGRGAGVNSTRAASGPAVGPRTTSVGAPGAARVAATRPSQGSVKDIASRFNQTAASASSGPAQPNGRGRARSGSSPRAPTTRRPTSRPNSRLAERCANGSAATDSRHSPGQSPATSVSSVKSAGSPRTLKKEPRSQPNAEGQSVSSPHLMSEVGDRPLFGEIVTGFIGEAKPGYGIDELEFRGSIPGSFPGSMHQPNAMFPHNRSRSEGEHAQPSEQGSPVSGRNTLSKKSPNHGRSQSDMSGVETPTRNPNPLGTSNSHLSPSSPQRRQRAPPARIPPKPSYPPPRTIHERAIPASKSTSALQARRRTPTPEVGKENRSGSRPVTPQLLTSRRYEPGVPQSAKSNQSLKAYINAPMPKTSPPLRSSRPRQPVSEASTAASRARAAERAASPTRSRQRRQLQKRATSKQRAPQSIDTIDVAARAAQIQQNIKEKVSQSSIDSKRREAEEGETGDTDAAKSAESVLDDVPEDISKEGSPGVPTLVLDTDHLPSAGDSEVSTATDFETDESPILGGPTHESSEEHNPPNKRPSNGSDALQRDLRDHYARTSRETNTPNLNHVSIPGGWGESLGADLAEGPPFSKEYEESINIMLGTTPVPPATSTFWPLESRRGNAADSADTESSNVSTKAPSQPVREPGQDAYTSHPENLSSDSPDDTLDDAGATFDHDLLTNNRLSTADDLRRESAAYTVIKSIFEYYHKSTYVPPETAFEFQQEVAKLSPYLAQHSNWTSREATLRYLEGLMKASPVPGDDSTDYDEKDVDIGAELDRQNGLDSSPGVAMVYSPKVWGRDSGGDTWYTPPAMSEAEAQTDAEPRQSYKPTPPPKDMEGAQEVSGPDSEITREDSSTPKVSNFSRPRLPEIDSSGEGLGLAIRNAQEDSSKVPEMPTSPPPPPPLQPFSADYHASGQPLRSPPSPSIYSRPPYSTILPARESDATISAPPKTSQDSFSCEDLSGTTLRASDARSPSPTQRLDPAAAALDKRLKTLRELVETENSFNQDMVVLEDIYKGTSSAIDIKDEDRRVLFGNSDQIVAFSRTFLDEIRRAVAPVYKLPRSNRWNHRRGSFSTVATEQSPFGRASDPDREHYARDRETTVGKAFHKHMARLEKVYGDYMKNHYAANARLHSLQQQPHVKLWMEECVSSAKDLTTAWDLDSLMVKPTQRVLKYPLLLGQILANTPKDHPDYEDIASAARNVEEAAGRINESMRRAQLVDQVMNRKRKESEPKLQLFKPLKGRTEKLKQQVGLSNTVDDQDYDAIAQRFGGHFFQLQIVMRDVEKYIEEVDIMWNRCNTYILVLEAFLEVEHTAFPEIESKWRKYSQCIRQITAVALKDHKADIRRRVIDPISTLWKLHEGPQKMMAKRKKRTVEFAIVRQAKERGDKVDKKLQEEADKFVAVNDTLKEELPKLYALTKQLIEGCLHNFIDIQMNWQMTWQRKMAAIVESPRKGRSLQDSMRDIEVAFKADFAETDDKIHYFGIINGSTLAEAANFLSPTASFPLEDGSSYKDFKRPSVPNSSKRTQSIGSNESVINSLDLGPRYNPGSYPAFTPMSETYLPAADGRNPPGSGGRMRSGSAISSRGPSTPRSITAQTPATNYFPNRPSTSRSAEPSPGFPRLSVEFPETQLSPSNANFAFPSAQTGTDTPPNRSSGIFSSAMPMSDSPPGTRPTSPRNEPPKILFLAASLFEFNIDGSRREAGYPYLRYVPGEVFDVIAQKGELWLARNQDDSSGLVGWIWEKHFARILPEEP